ncbi:hypothetical protein KAU19_08220, partial [Candidatus Parcubacteria bacterium]|nr:hypothetical protein [Candidatus Parcubacteria bacterium]
IAGIIGGFLLFKIFQKSDKNELIVKFQQFQQSYNQKQALGYDLTQVDLIVQQGKMAFNRGDYKEANKKLNQAIELLKKLKKPEEIVCGNGVCEKSETAKNCPEDCGEEFIHRIYSTSDFGFVADSAIKGNYIYFVGKNGLAVLDIVNPKNPKVLETLVSSIPFNDIFTEGNYAYVTAGQRRLPDGMLKIFDISNPQKIYEIENNLVLPEGPTGIFVKNSIAYVGDFASGLMIVDVKDPEAPEIISTYSLNRQKGHVWWFEVKDNYVYLPYDAEGFHILDISNPYNLIEVGSFNKKSPDESDYYFNDVAVAGDYAFITLDYAGMIVLDVSDVNNLKEVAHVDPWPNCKWGTCPGHMIQVEIKDSFAYLTAGKDGLYVYNISNPIQPVLVTKFPESAKSGKGCAWGLFIKDNLVNVGYNICKAQNIKGAFEIFEIK